MYELFDINNLVVVKHNRIIDAEYSMSVFEQRILLTCIAKIDSTKELDQNHIFTVSVDDIIDLVDAGHGGSTYAHLERSCNALFNNVISIEIPNSNKPLVTRWVYGVRYIDGDGKIELRFTPEIMPFLTKISSNFTKYNLIHVLKFKSIYSYRLYEWICHWDKPERTVGIDWLREKFQLTDKYERMVDFKKNVIDIAVREINATSNMNVTYEQIKKGRNVTALRFVYSIKQDGKVTTKKEPKAQQVLTLTEANTVDIDIIQLNDKEKVLARNALAKLPEATQLIILAMFKSALSKGNVKAPMRYLNGLINKSLAGDLDITAFTDAAPNNDFERQERRVKRIGEAFTKHGEQIKAELVQNDYAFIKGVGSVNKFEFEALSLIDKVPRPISTGKLQPLSEILAIAEKKILAEEEAKALQKRLDREKDAQQPKEVADIQLGVMSEKEIAARQMILELEAQLIAAGEFTGVNAMAISEDELTGLVEIEAMQARLMQNFDKK